MIIDFHTHIFPQKIRADRDALCAVEPAFRLLYESPKSKLVGVTDLINAMDENSVDVSVVFGFPWIAMETAKRNNDYIMEAVARFPDRIIGLGCMDPGHKDAPEEALRCLNGGLSGIGEIAMYQAGIDSDALKQIEPMMAICRDRNKPFLMHTNESVGHRYPGKAPITIDQIYDFAKAFPDNKIVLAHWGGGILFFNLLKREVQSVLKNVYFDTAASPFLYDPKIYQLAIDIVGNEKILFGSDYPLLMPKRYFKEMSEGGLSQNNMDMICGLNAKRLLNV